MAASTRQYRFVKVEKLDIPNGKSCDKTIVHISSPVYIWFPTLSDYPNPVIHSWEQPVLKLEEELICDNPYDKDMGTLVLWHHSSFDYNQILRTLENKLSITEYTLKEHGFTSLSPVTLFDIEDSFLFNRNVMFSTKIVGGKSTMVAVGCDTDD